MSDSQEIETTPETQTTPEVETQGGAQPASDPAPSNPPPEVPAGGEPSIPYSRFREVNEQRKQALQQLEQLRQAPQPQPSYMQPQAEQAPKQDQFETYEAFMSAHTAHTAKVAARSEFAALQQQQQQAWAQQQQRQQANQAMQNWNSKIADLNAKDPMFQQRAYDALSNMPADVGIAVMNSPAARELTVHFANHPEDAFRLASMHPIQAAMEVGMLGAKLAQTPPVAKVSSMPKPMAPVGSGKTGSKLVDDYNQNDVIARLYPRK